VTLPHDFDCDVYRAANPDLAGFSDAELIQHFLLYGESEGRRGDALASREDFAALVPIDADVLEIGPYYSPMLRGPRTKFFDVLTRDAMIDRAATDGFDASNAPEIDFVSPTGDLDAVDSTFDFAFSSHAIEHQPDLISHLQKVERLLRPGGSYLVIVPDKRYCYDHFSPESSLAEIVEAHVQNRASHTLRSVLGQSVMSTHNDCARHWNGDHGVFLEDPEPRIRAGVEAFAQTGEAYLDVHAWYFTPASTRAIFKALYEADLLTFQIERLYPTRRNTFEFWMILRK
jgi:SAM-dependent methyltransferase